MPYTPPSGNAVNFNFTGTLYTVPPGASIIFNFGGTPGPPFVDPQLPTGRKQIRVIEDDWFPYPQLRRPCAPVADAIISKPMRALRMELYEDSFAYERPLRRTIIATPPYVVGKRPIMFTVT